MAQGQELLHLSLATLRLWEQFRALEARTLTLCGQRTEGLKRHLTRAPQSRAIADL